MEQLGTFEDLDTQTTGTVTFNDNKITLTIVESVLFDIENVVYTFVIHK